MTISQEEFEKRMNEVPQEVDPTSENAAVIQYSHLPFATNACQGCGAITGARPISLRTGINGRYEIRWCATCKAKVIDFLS